MNLSIHRISGKKISVVITAGPTRERIDPVRFISNYATGTFGYALAKESLRRGCRVTLISGPTHLLPPAGARTINVESAREMRRAVLKEIKRADCLIMTSAVSDWRVKSVSRHKLKKGRGEMSLELVENPDILAEIGRKKSGKTLVGFALETEELEKNALKKLMAKNLDFIVANRFTGKNRVFGNAPLDLVLIDKLGNRARICKKLKAEAAKIILDKVFYSNLY